MPENARTVALRFDMSGEQADQLTALCELVAGDERAPTSVTEPAEIAAVHLADSLVALELEPVRTAGTLADLGAGAGFPGLPLAIALPRTRVTLVESVRRKCDFLERVVPALGLPNVAVACRRAESLDRAVFDVVTARALAELSVVAEYAAPLLGLGGMLVVWRGGRDPDSERDAATASAILGLRPLPPVPVTPYPGSQRRHLHPFVKVEETPARFPRAPGRAAKRPLRARSEDFTDRG